MPVRGKPRQRLQALRPPGLDAKRITIEKILISKNGSSEPVFSVRRPA
jgi:hypothetical protein